MADAERLSEEVGRRLLKVARDTIQRAFGEQKNDDPGEEVLSPVLSERRGTFVTLTLQGSLRGCIGRIIPQETLFEGVKGNAIRAAFRDPRFRPLSRDELDQVRIEVSILTEPAPLSYSDARDLTNKLRPGTDGVILKKGYKEATFLPQVLEQLPKPDDFLTHLCLKAGLEGDAWKRDKLDVSVYRVQAFEEE